MPRWIHKIWAEIFGYYWLPCPICGQYSGGHEIKEVVSVYKNNGIRIQLCKSQLCAYEAGVLDTKKRFPVILRKKSGD